MKDRRLVSIVASTLVLLTDFAVAHFRKYVIRIRETPHGGVYRCLKTSSAYFAHPSLVVDSLLSKHKR